MADVCGVYYPAHGALICVLQNQPPLPLLPAGTTSDISASYCLEPSCFSLLILGSAVSSLPEQTIYAMRTSVTAFPCKASSCLQCPHSVEEP